MSPTCLGQVQPTRFFLAWVGPSPTILVWANIDQAQQTLENFSLFCVNSGEWINSLFIVHMQREQWRRDGCRRTRRRRRRRQGKADLSVVLAVALVVLLPNKVVVHWGAASSVDGSSSSSQCAFPLFLFPFFFLFFVFAFAPPHLCFLPFSFVCFFFLSSLLPIYLCFSLFFPFHLFFFSFCFSPPKLSSPQL